MVLIAICYPDYYISLRFILQIMQSKSLFVNTMPGTLLL